MVVKKLKQIEWDRRVVERLGHFHRTRSQTFAFAEMASEPKKPRQTLLSTFFQKDNMNLKHWMSFSNQHLKIYHFTLFLKPVIEILRQRTVAINVLNFDCSSLFSRQAVKTVKRAFPSIEISKFSGWGHAPRPPEETHARKVSCRLLSQWGRLPQNLLTALL